MGAPAGSLWLRRLGSRPLAVGPVAAPGLVALLGAAVVGLAGCGGGGAARARHAPAPNVAALAQRTHELPTPPGPPERVPGAAERVREIRAFATAYINWTAQTVSGRMGALALASVGQARSAMALAAGETARDTELQAGGIANHGTVEAVAPLPGRPGQYLVVTRESTTATNTNAYQGLRPAWHVTVATVSRQPGGGWVISGWQPES